MELSSITFSERKINIKIAELKDKKTNYLN